MSVDRANEILFNQVHTENKKALKLISGKRSHQIKKFVNLVAKQTVELDNELKEYMEKSGSR